MPLESCMLVIDNSEYMRNGDYPPSRFDAQRDGLSAVFETKINSNPENTAGVMTMAGRSPEVLVTPTQDLGKILSALKKTKLGGQVDLVTAIQVAQLALKHRQNKNLRQRIVAYVGSPLGEMVDEKTLVRVGKKLKKNNVALDVIAYGEFENNEQRLRSLVDAVQNNDNSHFLIIPPGPHLMSDLIRSSPILRDPEAAAAEGEEGGGGFEFGFDPSLDPELALALRMSMEEEQARQRNANQASTSTAASAGEASSSRAVPNTEDVSTPKASASKALPVDDDMMESEDDPLLAQAIAMSAATAAGGGGGGTDADMEDGDEEGDDEEEDEEEEEEGDDEELTEEEAIAQAIALSMNPPKGKDEAMKDPSKKEKK